MTAIHIYYPDNQMLQITVSVGQSEVEIKGGKLEGKEVKNKMTGFQKAENLLIYLTLSVSLVFSFGLFPYIHIPFWRLSTEECTISGSALIRREMEKKK